MAILRREHEAIASSSSGKFNSVVEVGRWIGVPMVPLTWLQVAMGLDEPVKTDQEAVGRGKLQMFAPHIEQELRNANEVPRAVTIADLLVVAKLPGLSEQQAVLKKPEDEGAMEAFTSYFAMCLDLMHEKEIANLLLAYNMVMARAEVSERGRLKLGKRGNAITVRWDKMNFNFPEPLVKLLSDPGELGRLAKAGVPFAQALSTKSVAGFRMQDFIFMAEEMAGLKPKDGLEMEIHYPRGQDWQVTVDANCDLHQEVGVGVRGVERTVPLSKMVNWVTQNVSPWLVNDMFKQRRG